MSALEVLALHQWDMGEWCTCLCGAKFNRSRLDELLAAHQLDALKAAGYAVVELPKPDGPLGFIGGEGTGLAWRRVADPSAEAGGVATIAIHDWYAGEFAAAISCLRTPDDARWAAGALLAAADAAEAS